MLRKPWVMQAELAQMAAALTRPTGASSDFDLNPAMQFGLGLGHSLRPAAVLVAIWQKPDGLKLILTKRASHLKHHPGQIALPGGKVDDSDAGPIETALREAWEEIGLRPDAVQILGSLPNHETVTGFSIVPVIGYIRDDFTPSRQVGEVEEIFTVPLSHMLDPSRYVIEHRAWQGQQRRYYAVPFGPYYIWGATARIMRGLADRVIP